MFISNLRMILYLQ